MPKRFAALFALVVVASLGVWLTSSASARKGEAGGAEAAPAKPVLPPVVSLQLEPAMLTIADARDGRQVLVWGVTADGRKFDVSDSAVFKSDSPLVTVSEGRYLYPTAAGDASVTVSAEGKEAKLAVKVSGAEQKPVRFGRDVMPILASVGCNAGHLPRVGQGEERVQAFPPRLRRGRTTTTPWPTTCSAGASTRSQPDQSLMLLKPTRPSRTKAGGCCRSGRGSTT